MLIWNRRHLLHALREFETFSNEHRPYQGIANAETTTATRMRVANDQNHPRARGPTAAERSVVVRG